MASEKDSQGEASTSSSGSGGNQDQRQQNDNNQVVQVFGNDLYTVAFIFVLLLLGLLKAAQQRCTC